MKILILLLISCSLYATEHPIYNQILRNKPSINKQYAMKLSNIIHRVTRKYKIPSRVFTAILAQESGYKLEAKGCHTGYVHYDKNSIKECEDKVEKCWNIYGKNAPFRGCGSFPGCAAKQYKLTLTPVKVCTDFGLSQIFYKTARRYNLNILKLTTDLQYSVEAGAIVLAGFKKRYSKREKLWFTRYNSSNKIKRKIYYELIKRYL